MAAYLTDYDTEAIGYPDPSVFAEINKEESDKSRYHQAVIHPDWPDFKTAAVEEILHWKISAFGRSTAGKSAVK